MCHPGMSESVQLHVMALTYAPCQFATKKNSLVFLGLVAIETKRMSIQPQVAHAISSFFAAVYANSLLGSLNVRAYIRGPDPTTGIVLSTAFGATGLSTIPRETTVRPPLL